MAVQGAGKRRCLEDRHPVFLGHGTDAGGNQLMLDNGPVKCKVSR